jgi:hypothetical protein
MNTALPQDGRRNEGPFLNSPVLFIGLYFGQNTLAMSPLFFLLAIAGIIVFLVLREFWCWYFKVNLLADQNREIIRLLRKIAGEPPKKADD